MTTWALIKSDYRKIRNYGEGFFPIMLHQGFWAIFQYRIASRIYYSGLPKIIRKFLFLFTMLWQKVIEWTTGITIAASARIGHSFYIAHQGYIYIAPRCTIGNNCNISQGVTLGVSGTGVRRGAPQLGDNIYIGANAVCAGPVTVGSNSLIAACSLVINHVPEGAVMMGVPASVDSYKGSEGYI